MDVVLLERVEKLGQMGDVVKVKDGFARNFLLPKGKALRATKRNMERFETERVQLEARNLELKKEAEAVAKTLNGARFVAIRQASDAGALYGSVTSRDIADLCTEGGFTVARTQVILTTPVKELGMHDVRVILHPEVSATVTINVARSPDEAALQAQGKSIQDLRAEEEAAEAFDVAQLFEDDADTDEIIEDRAADETEQPR
ncbi:MAG: 50S ribosomal protein L9 [Pikeienuella sp.]|uniref:50S ribosomal protein L9 n=1 Tax=Pikeienuella sp. TaxID=2831957 RepID=UPI0039198491